MERDHERIEELLAGYALLALEGDDATDADRLLADHVPTCLRCRQTLADLQSLTGDLGLAAAPVAPPDLVLPRIHRGMDDVPLMGRSRRGAFVALAASVAALVAMGGLSLTMTSRAHRAEDQAGTLQGIVEALRAPNADPVTLDPQGTTSATSPLIEVTRPDVRTFYLYTDDCPMPEEGMAYEVWLGADGTFVPTTQFEPEDGRVLLEVQVDVTRYDEIWITEEAAGSTPSTPNPSSSQSWRATLVSN
jgi:Anti-sigma-K factor rskA, C-terminal